MSRSKVSVIVVNYNCYSTLTECLTSILLSRGVEELLLVDNASTDGSIEMAEKFTDVRLKIIRLKRNIGLAKARNLAAAKARGRYLAFTDADSKVDREWLQEPCILLEKHKEIGAVQCKILSYRHPDKISCAGVGFDGCDWKGMPKDKLNSCRRILFPIGAAFIIRREIWDLLKGFDPAFFVGNDDVDLGIRLWLSGYEVICSHRAIVYHDGGNLRSRKDVAPVFQFYSIKNLLSIWTKDLQGRTVVKEILPFSLLYPFMAFWRGGVPGVMGMLSFLKKLPSILVKRNEVQQLRKTSDEEIMPMLQFILPIQELTRDLRTLLKYVFREIELLCAILGIPSKSFYETLFMNLYQCAKRTRAVDFENDVYSPLFPRIKEYDCIVYTVGLGINLLRYNYTTDRILREEKLNVVYNSGFSYIAIKSSNFTYAPTG